MSRLLLLVRPRQPLIRTLCHMELDSECNTLRDSAAELSTGLEQKFQNIPSTSTSFRIAKPLAESLGIGRYRVFVRAYDQLERPGYWSSAR